MNEPIKLQDVPVSQRDLQWHTAATKALRAVEQATADLRVELAAIKVENAKAFDTIATIAAERDAWGDRYLKASLQRDEARAELARLTTLRPASEHDPTKDGYARWFFHTDDYWAEVGSDHRRPQYATHWVPLPPVKEADK